MLRPTFSRLLLAATALILLGQSSLADPIPWNFSTGVSPNFVTPDAGTPAPPPNPSFWGGSLGIGFIGTFGQTAGTSPISFAYWGAYGVLPGDVATFKHQ